MNDINLTDDFDLDMENGDLVVQDSQQQRVKLILLLNKGEVKQFPFIGFGIERRINGLKDNKRDISEMRTALEADGFSGSIVSEFTSIENFKIEL